MKFIASLCAAASIACVGCTHLTPAQKNSIVQAKNICSNAGDADVSFTVNVIPTWNKAVIDGMVASMHQNIQGDATVYLSLIDQDLCRISAASSGIQIRPWRDTLGKAFEVWQSIPANGTNAEQLEFVEKSRAALLAEVDKLPDDTMTALDFEVFDTLLPRHNFLIETSFKYNGGTDFIQGPLGANFDTMFGPSQFSVQLRTALESKRATLAFFALKKASKRDTIKFLVNDIYNSLRERIIAKSIPIAVK